MERLNYLHAAKAAVHMNNSAMGEKKTHETEKLLICVQLDGWNQIMEFSSVSAEMFSSLPRTLILSDSCREQSQSALR